MMDRNLSRMLFVWGVVLCAALCRPSSVRAQEPHPYRDYVLWSNQEFHGTWCYAGWTWTDPEGKSYATCTGWSVRIDAAPGQNSKRTQGMLYRNDLFPPVNQGRNMAVEMRIHYAALHGYGADAWKGYDGSYAGERTCFNGTHHYYGHPLYCPTAHTATTLLASHGKRHGVQRTADMYTGSAWVGFSEDTMTPGWLIVRYEYDASTNLWQEYVYLPSHGSWDWTQPYRAKAPDYRYTMTRDDQPVGIAIGHDVSFTGGGDSWGEGEWSVPEVDYIRVWTWTNPTIDVYARNPQGHEVNAARLGASFFRSEGSISGWLRFNESHYFTEIDAGWTSDPSIYAIGGLVRTYADQVLLGVTPQPVLVSEENTWTGTTQRYDGLAPWRGNRAFTYILATQTPTPTPTNTPTATATPTNTPPPTNTPTNTPTPTPDVPPTPTPWVHVEARNPQGEPVNVARVGSSAFWGAHAFRSGHNAHSYSYSGPIWTNLPGAGGSLLPYADQVVLGVTPQAQFVARTSYYYDGIPTWNTGRRDFTYVVATQTPTPTPTLAGSVRLRTEDGAGNPVAVPSIELLTSTGGTLNVTTGCVFCASATSVVMVGDTFKGARAVLDPNFVVMNLTTSHGGGSLDGPAGWIWPAPWAGLRDILIEVATVTPTATPTVPPTPTHTPTPAPPSWEVRIPQGSVFVNVYVPHSDLEDRRHYATDHVFSLEIQRWSGMAPIFRTDGGAPVELCQVGGSCYPGHTLTTHFHLDEIAHLTETTPDFAYPNGKVISYHREHPLHDNNLEDDEYLWLLVLSQGGNMPAAPAGPQAVAHRGAPGTYRFSGTLDIRSSWYAPTDAPIDHVHEWSIPIAFYAAVKAPYPQSP